MLADRYTILRLLGVGGMGMVYLAHDEQLDLDIALKVLRTGGAASEMRLERFRSELVLARQISHRNVVRIHDIGQSGDLYFITMDYVDGQSLKHLLELDGALDAERARQIVADLADALAEAHRAGVVHRDIKPANVLLADDRAYVTDFGIARSLHADGMTTTGEVIGTLDYLSPEQARGEPVDGRADIYALGLLLFEMLTGKRPFTGETAEEVLAQRTLARPRDLTAGNAALPPHLRAVITRCLAVDPDDRYQTADELAEELRSGSVSRRWRRPLRAAAAISVAGLLGYFLWTTVPDLLQEPADPAGDAEIAESIAVLPFDVSVSVGDLTSLSQGLAELLAEQLSAAGSVPVVSGQRVSATLRDLKLSVSNLPQSDQALLGDLLDADYLVVGSVQQIGDNFHVEGRLRHAVTGNVVHRASYDVDSAAGVFATLTPMAAALLSNLDASMDEPDALAVPDDPQALSAFSSGVELLSQGNALDAVLPLQDAVRRAPEFALAWDRLAQALSALGRDRDALTAAESAVAALGDNGSRTAALVRARKEALGGEPANSMLVLEALLRDHPDDNDARFLLAEVYGDAGRLQEAEQALQRVVGASPDHPQAWYLLGKFAILRGDARRAADDYLVKALVIQNRLENDQGRADALNAMGIAAAQLGNAESAENYYQQALELRRRIGDERGVAAVLANLARISLRDGRYDEARADLVEARDKLSEIGDRWTVANLENELGYLEEQRGRFNAALDHYRESLSIRDDLGDSRALAESYNNIGYIYYLLGEYDSATVFNERSLTTYRETDNSEGVMYASQIRGILDSARGRYDDALKALLECLQISRDLDAPHVEAVTEGYIGIARFLQGQYAAARLSFESALERLAGLGDDRGRAEFMLHDAELSMATGMLDSAGQSVSAAAGLLADDDNAAARAFLLRMQGLQLAAGGDADEAAERFEAALSAAEVSGERAAILKARLARAARSTATDREGELRDILTTSRRLGHGRLEVESTIALASAYLQRQRFDDAEATLREARPPGRGAAEFHGDYQLHALLAEVLSARGRDGEAASAWRQARQAVERALAAQNAGQRAAFVRLATVQRVLEQSEMPE